MIRFNRRVQLPILTDSRDQTLKAKRYRRTTNDVFRRTTTRR